MEGIVRTNQQVQYEKSANDRSSETRNKGEELCHWRVNVILIDNRRANNKVDLQDSVVRNYVIHSQINLSFNLRPVSRRVVIHRDHLHRLVRIAYKVVLGTKFYPHEMTTMVSCPHLHLVILNAEVFLTVILVIFLSCSWISYSWDLKLSGYKLHGHDWFYGRKFRILALSHRQRGLVYASITQVATFRADGDSSSLLSRNFCLSSVTELSQI